MDQRPTTAALALGGLVAVGMAIAGYLIGHGLLEARAADRFVTVKGLSERVVPADLVVWPLVFTVTGDDLATIQRRVDESAGLVQAFLLEEGFEAAEVSVSAPRLTDREAQGYRPQGPPLDRYVAEATVTLRTGRVDQARASMARSGELVRRGVALIRSYESETRYLFTALSDIKPEMIAEATRDARAAAQQFAEDSGSEVGAIRTAQQGYFSIEDRDPFSPEHKKVRVVTTIEYFLRD